MPTPAQMMEIIQHLYEPPTWLWPGERVVFAESSLVTAEHAADEWRFVAMLVGLGGQTLAMSVSGINARVLRMEPRQKRELLTYMHRAVAEAVMDLRPTRGPAPHVLQILDLALKCEEDAGAEAVLGDLVLETGWYDERVITHFWTKIHDAVSEREMFHHLAADCSDPKLRLGLMKAGRTGPWAQIKRQWARAIAAVILFGEWPARYVYGHDYVGACPWWPVVSRCSVEPFSDLAGLRGWMPEDDVDYNDDSDDEEYT